MAEHSKVDPPLDIELPITPMLDLAFQVLLFFILTYHPSQLEGQMELSLPDAAQAQAANPKDARPDASMQGEPELPSEITVVVKTQLDGTHNGGISRISVQERSGTKDVPNLDELRKYLEQARKGLTNQDDIKIQADSALKYAAVMEVMDACNRARFRNVNLGPPADLGAN